ncbi:unnamed protein product, partial [Ectocarpus sp. 12 AP-2014]
SGPLFTRCLNTLTLGSLGHDALAPSTVDTHWSAPADTVFLTHRARKYKSNTSNHLRIKGVQPPRHPTRPANAHETRTLIPPFPLPLVIIPVETILRPLEDAWSIVSCDNQGMQNMS